MEPSIENIPVIDAAGLLRAHGLYAKKGLGQNFMIDPLALQKLISVAAISKDCAVLEIGPGLGSLTRYLAEAARRVVAVELDAALLPILQEVVAPWKNITILQGDILDKNPAELMKESGYLVVANIPYYITSALMRHLLEAPLKPARLVLTVQKEVAQRICATPGNMSLLALSVQVYGKPHQVARLPANAFYPQPKVDSTIVRVDLYPEPLIPASRLKTFFWLVKAGFAQKRKTLRNSLSAGLGWKPAQVVELLTALDINPQRRAETLSLDEWNSLTALVAGTSTATARP
jgi:16S rRNA (adenine1518-N6/adenine1519-N6)-dimethyltransferase